MDQANMQTALQAYQDYKRLVEQLTVEQTKNLDAAIASIEQTKIQTILHDIENS